MPYSVRTSDGRIVVMDETGQPLVDNAENRRRYGNLQQYGSGSTFGRPGDRAAAGFSPGGVPTAAASQPPISVTPTNAPISVTPTNASTSYVAPGTRETAAPGPRSSQEGSLDSPLEHVAYLRDRLAQLEIPAFQFESGYKDRALAQQLEQANRDRYVQEIMGRGGLIGGSLGGASQEALARQNLAMAGYGQAEVAKLARRQQGSNEAFRRAELMASLRGPANAWKQLEVNMGLGNTGMANLRGALTGDYRAPSFQAPQARPVAATLETLTRDIEGRPYADAPGEKTPTPQGSSIVAEPEPDAISGMMDLAGRNAGNWGMDSPTAREQMRQATIHGRALSEIPSGDPTKPDPGGLLYAHWRRILRENNGVAPPWDHPTMLQAWVQATGMSLDQVRGAAYFTSEYTRATGRPLQTSQINDLVGAVEFGMEINPADWRIPPTPRRDGQPWGTYPPVMTGTDAGPLPGPGIPPPGSPGNPPSQPRPATGAGPAGTPGHTSPVPGLTPPAPPSNVPVIELPPIYTPPGEAPLTPTPQPPGYTPPTVPTTAPVDPLQDWRQGSDGNWREYDPQGRPTGRIFASNPAPAPPPATAIPYPYGPPGGNPATAPGAGQPAPSTPPTTTPTWVTMPNGQGAYQIGSSYYDGTGARVGTVPGYDPDTGAVIGAQSMQSSSGLAEEQGQPGFGRGGLSRMAPSRDGMGGLPGFQPGSTLPGKAIPGGIGIQPIGEDAPVAGPPGGWPSGPPARPTSNQPGGFQGGPPQQHGGTGNPPLPGPPQDPVGPPMGQPPYRDSLFDPQMGGQPAQPSYVVPGGPAASFGPSGPGGPAPNPNRFGPGFSGDPGSGVFHDPTGGSSSFGGVFHDPTGGSGVFHDPTGGSSSFGPGEWGGGKAGPMDRYRTQGNYVPPGPGPQSGAVAPSPGAYTGPSYVAPGAGASLQQQQSTNNDFLRRLPAPNRINSASFLRLPKSAQDLALGAYEAVGYDKADVAGTIGNLLPRAIGPQRGYIAPRLRAT